MTGFEIPLVLWIFGYLQPGRTAAAANGVREPLGSYGGACPSFGPSRSHRFGTGCGRTLFVFRVFGGSGGHPPIKKCESIPAQDYLGRPMKPAAFSAVRHPKCGCSCRRRSRRTREVDALLRPSTSNGHLRLQVEPALAGSERLCLLAKPCPYSLNAFHQVCARDAQATSDGGIIPAIY